MLFVFITVFVLVFITVFVLVFFICLVYSKKIVLSKICILFFIKEKKEKKENTILT